VQDCTCAVPALFTAVVTVPSVKIEMEAGLNDAEPVEIRTTLPVDGLIVTIELEAIPSVVCAVELDCNIAAVVVAICPA